MLAAMDNSRMKTSVVANAYAREMRATHERKYTRQALQWDMTDYYRQRKRKYTLLRDELFASTLEYACSHRLAHGCECGREVTEPPSADKLRLIARADDER